MLSFDDIYAIAVRRKGGERLVESSLPVPKSDAELRALPDDRFLSELSRRVFRAGLKHSMVDAKWPAFEVAFKQFNVQKVASLSDEDLEKLASDKTIIRHFGKIRSVRENARWLMDVIEQYGSVGELIANWPIHEIVDLWTLLKKQGTQLGGQSGSRFLRMVGKDTFLLTDDVVAVLKKEKIVDKAPTSQRDLRKSQQAFNHWQEQSGRPLCAISRIISYTAGDDTPY